MAYVFMAYIVMAYVVMAYIVMACAVMAYVVMAYTLTFMVSLSRVSPRSISMSVSTSPDDNLY